MQSLFKKIALNAGTLASGSVINSAIGLISFSLLARELGAELFGVLALVQVYAVIIDGLMNFQSWQALIKYGTPLQMEGKLQELGQLYSFGFLVDFSTALLAGIVGVSLPMLGIGGWLGWEEIKVAMASIFAVSIIFNIEGTPTAIFRMYDRYQIFVIKGSLMAVLRLLLVLGGMLTDQGVWFYFYAIFFSQIIGYIFFLVVALNFLKSKNINLSWPKVSASWISGNYPGIFSFILNTNLHGTIRMTSLRVDTLIVDAYLGSAATGLYQVAKQFSRVFTQVSQPLYKVIYPELTKLWAVGKKAEFISLVKRFCGFAALFGAMVWVIFLLFPEWIVYLTVGEDYYGSIPVLLFYLLGVVISVSAFPITPAVLAMGYPKISFRVQLVSTMIYFIALFGLLPSFGVVGAGVAYAVLYFAWTIVMFFTYRFYLKEKLYESEIVD